MTGSGAPPSRLITLVPKTMNCCAEVPTSRSAPLIGIPSALRRDGKISINVPIDTLMEILPSRLSADGIPINGADLLVGTSAQQFIVLGTSVISRLGGAPEPVIAVEQPGYYTIFDTF